MEGMSKMKRTHGHGQQRGAYVGSSKRSLNGNGKKFNNIFLKKETRLP